MALIQRATCTFEEKVDNAIEAGHDGVIIFNEATRAGPSCSSAPWATPSTSPGVALSFADGAALYAQAVAGRVVETLTEMDLKRSRACSAPGTTSTRSGTRSCRPSSPA